MLFFPFGLKVACCFFTSYLGFKVKFSIKILPLICRPKQRFLFLWMASFFWGGEAIKHPLPETKGSSKNPWVGQFLSQAFLSKRGKIKALKSQGAKGFALWPLFRSEVIGTNTRLRGWKLCWDFTEGNSPTAKRFETLNIDDRNDVPWKKRAKMLRLQCKWTCQRWAGRYRNTLRIARYSYHWPLLKPPVGGSKSHGGKLYVI